MGTAFQGLGEVGESNAEAPATAREALRNAIAICVVRSVEAALVCIKCLERYRDYTSHANSAHKRIAVSNISQA